MTNLWMIRSEGGNFYDTFRTQKIAAIGWPTVSAYAINAPDKAALAAHYRTQHQHDTPAAVSAAVGQIWRFLHEVADGDHVITYNPATRQYSLGTIIGEATYCPDNDPSIRLTRAVQWQPQEISRDRLSTSAKNTLGSVLTIFKISPTVSEEILSISQGKDIPAFLPEENDAEPLPDIEEQAIEHIKDKVNELDWSEMQKLVAGILRAMGYKTRISENGADQGKDVIASPDGFGFEHPRIIVEVKHRKGQMDSKSIRSFLGGSHKDDRGLYVSTGGFTKDAKYEAERASIPVALWTLDDLVRALFEHYENTDSETKLLIPLKRLYWLA